MAGAVAHRQAARQHPAEGAVAMAQAVLALEMGGSPLQVLADLAPQPGAIAGVHAREPLLGAAGNFALLVAEHCRPAGRVVDLLALEVPVPEAVVGAARRQRIALLAAA